MRVRLALVSAVALLTSSAPVLALTWTVPGTVNASGLNGTRFVSDLAITNPGSAPVPVTLALVPARATSPTFLSLNPGQTIVTRNVLQQLWGATGAAATIVTADAPLLIRARTYNTSSSGTFGVALPVFQSDRLLRRETPARASGSASPRTGRPGSGRTLPSSFRTSPAARPR